VFGLQGQELIVILVIVLILFGGKKIPELMRSLGQGLREFRKASTDAVEDIRKAAEIKPDDEE
jgi:sec-independent protein translocase protein TatA